MILHVVGVGGVGDRQVPAVGAQLELGGILVAAGERLQRRRQFAEMGDPDVATVVESCHDPRRRGENRVVVGAGAIGEDPSVSSGCAHQGQRAVVESVWIV